MAPTRGAAVVPKNLPGDGRSFALSRGAAPGNVLLGKRATGLPKKSVANVSQVVTLDRSLITKRVRALPSSLPADVETGLRLVLDL